LEAYQLIEDERCGSCGLPLWMCRNESETIQFRTVEIVCNATRARELAEEKFDEKNKKPHGTFVRAEPFSTNGSPLSLLRRSYYEGEQRRREAMEG
jgi:hypothetical protein